MSLRNLVNSRLINFNSDSRMDKGSKKCPAYKLVLFSTTLASLPLILPVNDVIMTIIDKLNLFNRDGKNPYPCIITKEEMVDHFRP